MGKKVQNPKLLKQQKAPSLLSLFHQHANSLAQAHRKKIEKVGDTKQRLLDNQKHNRLLKASKRTSKFALIEDSQPSHGLTHRGTRIQQLSQFNDMNFDSDVEDQEFLRAHEDLNFTGFDEEPQEQPQNPDRPKTKTEVYKEIIEKSKLHKHLRQEVYEENFEKAV
jgi:nucleolar protein 14